MDYGAKNHIKLLKKGYKEDAKVFAFKINK